MHSDDRAAPPPRALLVDDNRQLLGQLAELLAEHGIRVAGTCERGEGVIAATFEAITEYGALDVIVMDVSMPGMDGISATRLTRVMFPDVEVILHSAHEPTTDEPGEDVDAYAYVVKGQPSEVLISAIREATLARRTRLADAHACTG